MLHSYVKLSQQSGGINHQDMPLKHSRSLRKCHVGQSRQNLRSRSEAASTPLAKNASYSHKTSTIQAMSDIQGHAPCFTEATRTRAQQSMILRPLAQRRKTRSPDFQAPMAHSDFLGLRANTPAQLGAGSRGVVPLRSRRASR